jgi:hypothetical protein
MLARLTDSWRTWREKRREEMRERLALQFERTQDHGGAPIPGGYGVKLLAVAVLVAVVVFAVWLERTGLKY